MAKGKTFAKMRKDENGQMKAVRVPEHLDVLAGMACGAQAHFQISKAMGLSEPPGATLYGTEGTLRFSQGRLFGGRKGDTELQEIQTKLENEGWRVEDEFINAIRGNEPITRTRFEDGVKYMEFTEAVFRSMTERREIALPLLTL